MAKLRFTKSALDDLRPTPGRSSIYYDTGDVRGFALQVTPAGRKTFLLVYVAKATGTERRMVIGEFGRDPNLSIAAARNKAMELRAAVNSGRDPWREAKESRAEAQAEKLRKEATLAGLLTAYVGQLREAGKPSAKEVESSVARNLIDQFPAVSKLPATRVTAEDVLPVLHRLTRAGKWRAAEKLAIYLRAAYSAAKAARIDAAGFAYRGFDIRSNPLQDLRVSRPRRSAADASQNASERKWALSDTELRLYWARIKHMSNPRGALLRLHLLLGGQRVEQLSRLRESDWDRVSNSVTLWDGKGRRMEPRKHVLPLLPLAWAAVDELRTNAIGPYIFSVCGGSAPAVPHTLAAAMREISRKMLEDGEVSKPITPGVIRRTIETLLADWGVSRDARAQLLSHGVGGVQERHYDASDHMRAKRGALELLHSNLDSHVSNVYPLIPKGKVSGLGRGTGKG